MLMMRLVKGQFLDESGREIELCTVVCTKESMVFDFALALQDRFKLGVLQSINLASRLKMLKRTTLAVPSLLISSFPLEQLLHRINEKNRVQWSPIHSLGVSISIRKYLLLSLFMRRYTRLRSRVLEFFYGHEVTGKQHSSLSLSLSLSLL